MILRNGRFQLAEILMGWKTGGGMEMRVREDGSDRKLWLEGKM